MQPINEITFINNGKFYKCQTWETAADTLRKLNADHFYYRVTFYSGVIVHGMLTSKQIQENKFNLEQTVNDHLTSRYWANYYNDLYVNVPLTNEVYERLCLSPNILPFHNGSLTCMTM